MHDFVHRRCDVLDIINSIINPSIVSSSLKCYSGNYTMRRRAAVGDLEWGRKHGERECPRRPATILFSTMGGGGGVESVEW